MLSSDRINRHSKVPLYHQLYELLRALIVKGEWRPGDRVPRETELMARYQVSRTTMRQVLGMLTREGLIVRRRGVGTAVAHPTLEQGLVRIVSFTEDMRQRGYEPRTRLLHAGLAPAPPDIAAKLEVEPGEELVRLDRLRFADGEPIGIEESHLVHRYCRGILEGDYVTQSLRAALEQRYGITLVRARQTIRAIVASAALARLLAVRPSAALLSIERVSYSQQNVPVELLRLYYHGDRYVLYNELQG